MGGLLATFIAFIMASSCSAVPPGMSPMTTMAMVLISFQRDIDPDAVSRTVSDQEHVN
ncbi:MAG: hypothetical protein HYX89_00670 [Chloroflexi bacterium]|nr:hypothetical protein [Chloroflexota bacterium]